MDSVRADHVSCYGYKRQTTPRLDDLSRRGTFFRTVISTSSWTLPSHMSMLTGLVPELHQVTPREPLDPLRPMLTEILERSHFQTAAFVSSPYLEKRYGFSRGFQTYKNFWSAINKKNAGPETADHDRTGTQVVQSAFNWLANHNKDRFFLFLHFWEPHYDYIPPPPYDTRFVRSGYQPKISMTGYYPNPLIRNGMPQEDLEYVISQYDGEISYTDELIGRVIERLKDLKLMDKTLVLVTADHGDEFFEHGQKGHRKTLYDEVILIPLIVSMPGMKPNPKGIDNQISSIDYAPTILSAVGLGPHPDMMGRNLIPLLKGESRQNNLVTSRAYALRPAPFAISQFKEQFSLRLPSWKAIDDPKRKVLKVYDLVHDPGEKNVLPASASKDAMDLKQKLYLFRTKLDQTAVHQKKTGTKPIVIEDEEREKMKTLGYVD